MVTNISHILVSDLLAAAGITELTSDVTAGPGSGSQVATIAANAVVNTKLADMAQSTLKGRAAGAGTGDPTDLTAAQVLAILGLTSGILAWGTYTPVLANLVNLTGAFIQNDWQFARIGNFIVMAGGVNLNVAVAATVTSFTMTIPVASSFPAIVGEGCGGGTLTNGGETGEATAVKLTPVIGAGSTTLAGTFLSGAGVAAVTYNGVFGYQVI
jgi:hypothetical protein